MSRKIPASEYMGYDKYIEDEDMKPGEMDIDDAALNEWQTHPQIEAILTSKAMGAWLKRRDSRMLDRIEKHLEGFGDTDLIKVKYVRQLLNYYRGGTE